MFHVGMWRERLRNAFVDVSEGRSLTPPPSNIDEVNDAELANGIGTPLADAAARADHLLAELIDLYAKLGDRPFAWGLARTTTEALLRNSYTHPRVHIYGYWRENGDRATGVKLLEDGLTEMREASGPGLTIGTLLYNVACIRAVDGESEAAVKLLEEALELRPDMKAAAGSEPDLELLHDDPRYQELVKS